VVTRKGKGYGPAESDAGTFHGVGVFDPDTGTTSKSTRKTFTQVFGETALEIAERLPNAVAVTAAMTDNTGLKGFARKFPERFFDVGMAEEHGVTFSAAGGAGASAAPSTPPSCSAPSIRSFATLRCRICTWCCAWIAPVWWEGRQHGPWGSALRMFPGMVLMVPRSGELRDMLWTAAHHRGGAVAVRYPRANIGGNPARARPRRFHSAPRAAAGRRRRGDRGSSARWWIRRSPRPSCSRRGHLRHRGRRSLARSAAVRPGSRAPVGRIGRGERADGRIRQRGERALGRENLSSTPMLRIALPETFVTHGKRDELLRRVGLDPASIARRVKEWVRTQQPQDSHQSQYS
jgi:1-deoxy-D-xylulose-5-phosphate synthase